MSRNKKVLIASGSRHTIPPVHSSPGVPRIIFQLTEHDTENFQFVVLSKYDKELDAIIFNKHKYLHPKYNLPRLFFKQFLKIMPYRWRKRKYGFSQTDRIIYYTSLVNKAKKINPDIVVTFMHVELFKMIQKALPASKHIFFFRSTDLKGRIGQDNINFILQKSSGFLANTKAPIDELKRINSNSSFPMATIYNAVPEINLSMDDHQNIRTTFRKKFGLDSSTFVLGYAGRFSEEKSLLELFGVLKELKEEGVVVHLIIAGDIANEKTPNRSYYADLVKFKETYLSKQVHFAGWITNAELYQFYCALDVGVLLSKYREGNSMFLIEAMSFGLPVIATAVGGNKEIITSGLNGILVDPEKMEKDLKLNIISLLKDSSKYIAISNNARAYIIENHSNEKMIASFHNFLKQI
ncbi:glycosyltransferase family 4 protein [Aequorivita sp. SDUM287046]|uniref:Glycosyltransferase family 4 protein n=1 Tax=Aequorivita aurantiaca TaxID=3053356 RepID=A0ABT8DK34_9FLAO|nr:glycosyltransferase family 4 protein [Aequorivita aurantiaca]MDN3725292.1 glycosyltransferase family 4 protein [Aequorivita aurantiaca]